MVLQRENDTSNRSVLLTDVGYNFGQVKIFFFNTFSEFKRSSVVLLDSIEYKFYEVLLLTPKQAKE